MKNIASLMDDNQLNSEWNTKRSKLQDGKLERLVQATMWHDVKYEKLVVGGCWSSG